MSTLPWFYQLRDPRDLLAALRHLYQELAAQPDSFYLAFAFFAAADYLLYRAYPGYANRVKRERLLEANPLLHACSRLAKGSEQDLVLEGGVEESAGGPMRKKLADPECREEGCPYEVLYVHLEGGERHERSSIGAAELAWQVLDFWERHSRF